MEKVHGNNLKCKVSRECVSDLPVTEYPIKCLYDILKEDVIIPDDLMRQLAPLLEKLGKKDQCKLVEFYDDCLDIVWERVILCILNTETVYITHINDNNFENIKSTLPKYLEKIKFKYIIIN